MSMDMPFLKEHLYITPRFLGRDGNLFRAKLSFSLEELAIPELGRDGIFLGLDCPFFRTSWKFHNLTRVCNVLGRDCHFFRTSWQFRDLRQWDELVTVLGRDGHRLTNSKIKNIGGMHFVIIGGWGPIIGGIYNPSPLIRHRC